MSTNILVPPLGIEPSSTVLQTVAMTTSAKAALGRWTGVEPYLTVSQTVVRTGTLSPALAGPERFELPTPGFEDQHSSTELRTDGWG